MILLFLTVMIFFASCPGDKVTASEEDELLHPNPPEAFVSGACPFGGSITEKPNTCGIMTPPSYQFSGAQGSTG